MAVYKVHKSDDYVLMPNHHLRDTRLSLDAIGLLSLMLGIPEDEDVSVDSLASMVKDSEADIYKVIDELVRFGYMREESNGEDREFYMYPNPTDKGSGYGKG